MYKQLEGLEATDCDDDGDTTNTNNTDHQNSDKSTAGSGAPVKRCTISIIGIIGGRWSPYECKILNDVDQS